MYFQPPSGHMIKYPAIIYERRTGNTEFADNWPYIYDDCYTVTVIDKDPDSPYSLRVAWGFQMCKKDRFYTSDNLNHDVFILYY